VRTLIGDDRHEDIETLHFDLFLLVPVPTHASAEQKDEIIRRSCTPQDYGTYRQIFIRQQQALADAPPDVLPLSELLDNDFRRVSPQCRQAVVSVEAIRPGRRCTTLQQQKMIANNSATKWPQPLRTDCWNF
jgi:hypothetical protein